MPDGDIRNYPKVTQFADLADAMLLGCKLSKQGFDVYFARNPTGEITACALGAMFLGLGYTLEDFYSFPSGKVEQRYLDHYGISIARDNDTKLHTREQIAERIRALP